jgi:hypothetical protein
MHFIGYWKLVLSEAWAESLDLAQAKLFVAVALIGGTILIFPRVFLTPDFSDILDSHATFNKAALVLGSIIAARVIIAPYNLWRRVVDENRDLKTKVTPKVRLWFDPDDRGIQDEITETFSMGEPLPVCYGQKLIPDAGLSVPIRGKARYIRLQAETLSTTEVARCLAHITRLSRITPDGRYIAINLPHGISLFDKPRDIWPLVPFTIDLLICDNTNNGPMVPVPWWPSSLLDAFTHPGSYLFEIVVTASGVSESIRVQIDWKGRWNTLSGRQIA